MSASPPERCSVDLEMEPTSDSSPGKMSPRAGGLDQQQQLPCWDDGLGFVLSAITSSLVCCDCGCVHIPARGKAKLLRSPVKQETLDGSSDLNASPTSLSKAPIKGEQLFILQPERERKPNGHISRNVCPTCDCRPVCYRKEQSQEGQIRVHRSAAAGRGDADGHDRQEMDPSEAAEPEPYGAHLWRWDGKKATISLLWIIFYLCLYFQTVTRTSAKESKHILKLVGAVVPNAYVCHSWWSNCYLSQVLTLCKLRWNVHFFSMIRELKMGRFSMSRIFSREQPNLHQVRTYPGPSESEHEEPQFRK